MPELKLCSPIIAPSFIASDRSRTGNLVRNPLHRDMLFAAKKAGLAFISMLPLMPIKNHCCVRRPSDKAHRDGCKWVSRRANVKRQTADIVITSWRLSPRQIFIRPSKGMTAAEACVREGGVIIIAAACEDGHGGEAFYRWFAEAKTRGKYPTVLPLSRKRILYRINGRRKSWRVF